jgi:hypothetical protein
MPDNLQNYRPVAAYLQAHGWSLPTLAGSIAFQSTRIISSRFVSPSHPPAFAHGANANTGPTCGVARLENHDFQPALLGMVECSSI